VDTRRENFTEIFFQTVILRFARKEKAPDRLGLFKCRTSKGRQLIIPGKCHQKMKKAKSKADAYHQEYMEVMREIERGEEE